MWIDTQAAALQMSDIKFLNDAANVGGVVLIVADESYLATSSRFNTIRNPITQSLD